MYDAAIEPSGINDKRDSMDGIFSQLTQVKKEVVNSIQTQAQTTATNAGKRYCCYVGNMTWWTTDTDLQVCYFHICIINFHYSECYCKLWCEFK